MQDINDHVAFYLSNVNDSLASIYLNLGLGPVAPVPTKPWLLWVWVYFKAARSDGLSGSEEAPTLFALEDAITGRVRRSCDALPCGSITTLGRREFYFYGATSEGFEVAVRNALEFFKDYKFDLNCQLDPEWRHFLNVLYPSPDQFQCIMNREVLDSLDRNGDVHSIARVVDHFLYFSTDAGRSLFCAEFVKNGFEVAKRMENVGEYGFGVQLNRLHSVEQETIDAIVLNLMRGAIRFGGEYDGWGCTATSE